MDPRSSSTVIRRGKDSCPSSPTQGTGVYEYFYTEEDDELQFSDYPEEPGHYCYSLFSRTVYGDVSPRAVAEVDWS